MDNKSKHKNQFTDPLTVIGYCVIVFQRNMSIDHYDTIPYKVYKGMKVPKSANECYLDAACHYQPQENDIFIATYPKCGTTWVQHIVYLIFKEGRPASNISEIISSIPFPEQDGFPDHNKWLALKYHLTLELTPFSNDSKYIYVVRNPLDTCVSYYHFLKDLPGYDISGIDSFFESFLKGEVPYGDFFDHLLSWCKSWQRPNVLVLTYESLKESHKESVKRIASFLGMEYIACNDKILNDIVRYSKSDFMRALVDEGKFMKRYLRLTSSDGMRDVFKELSESNAPEPPHSEQVKRAPRMIRKGCVGDWKKHLSKHQARRMKEAFLSRTRGTRAENLWPDIFRDL